MKHNTWLTQLYTDWHAIRILLSMQQISYCFDFYMVSVVFHSPAVTMHATYQQELWLMWLLASLFTLSLRILIHLYSVSAHYKYAKQVKTFDSYDVSFVQMRLHLPCIQALILSTRSFTSRVIPSMQNISINSPSNQVRNGCFFYCTIVSWALLLLP